MNSTGTSASYYDAVFRAASVRDVALLMPTLGVLGANAEVAGAGNAMSDKDESKGEDVNEDRRPRRVRVELTGFQRLIHFDKKKGVVKVEAGMSLRRLVEILLKNEYQLPSLPILLDQTIGGCISTGSHGTSFKFGTVSDSVCGVTVVSDTGGVVCCQEGDGNSRNEDVLRFLRCGLGKVGVICEVELKVEKLKRFVRHEVILSCVISTQVKQLQELGENYDHVWVHWKLGSGSIAICLEAVEAGGEPYDGRNWYPFSSELSQFLESGSSSSNRKGTRKFTLQYSYPIHELERVIIALSKSLETKQSTYIGRVLEMKFLAASQKTAFAPNSVLTGSSLASAFVCVNVWWDCIDSSELRLLEATLQTIDIGATAHLGKWHDPRGAQMRTAEAACGQARGALANLGAPDSTAAPVLSVIMPVYNAMPYLPLALRDVLKQGVPNNTVEIVVSDDCSKDGSYEFLLEVASLLQDRASIVVESAPPPPSSLYGGGGGGGGGGDAPPSNPALLLPSRPASAEISSAVAASRPAAIEMIFRRPMTAAEVAACAAPGVRLKVVVQGGGARRNMGQGATMSRCLKHTTGRFIGFMESDDERDDGNYLEMLRALVSDASVQGVCCATSCIGWEREGMERYVSWQNGLLSASALRLARFVEIPTLMQAAVVSREAAWMATGGTGNFRDDAKWAVDMHFWMLFFGSGCNMKRVGAEERNDGGKDAAATTTRFLWRQHPGQQTRMHGRLSVENLRKCKCEFIWQDLIAGRGVAAVEVWGVGKTLSGWVEDVRSEVVGRAGGQSGGGSSVSVCGLEWEGSAPQGKSSVGPPGSRRTTVRLFAFGMQKARDKVRSAFARDWDDEFDVFVA